MKLLATVAAGLLLVAAPVLEAQQGTAGQGSGGQENAASQNNPQRPGWFIQAGKQAGGKPAQTVADPSILTEAEVFDLTFMRAEEKLARDVYLTLGAGWDLQIFTNIAESEQRHMDAMKVLLDRYGLPDPVTSNDVGVLPVVGSVNFTELYTYLVSLGAADGNNDQVDALTVGAWIEERDMLDIQNAITDTAEDDVPNADIVRTYESLLCGSRNHLRAFVDQIEEISGSAYVAQISTDPEWQAFIDAIIDSETERCGRKVIAP